MLSRKKELINETRKRQEDLEFQLMELETRYEAELEQAEFTFQNERLCANQNAKIRQVYLNLNQFDNVYCNWFAFFLFHFQNTLRDLDHQQKVILQQAALEKEKLEREKQKLKFLFKQKKMEANELEQKINELASSQEKNIQVDFQQEKKTIWFYYYPNNSFRNITSMAMDIIRHLSFVKV